MLLLAQDRIRISDRAQAKIRAMLAERSDVTERNDVDVVRLFAEKTSDGAVELGLAFDRRRDDDVVVPAEGVTLLADAQTLAVARDRVIDYEPQGFTFAKDSACEAGLFTE